MQINDPDTLASLTVEVERYEAALMANDIATLDAMFWNSPLVVRLGVGENLYGSEEIAAFRLARRGGSPARRPLRTTVTTFGLDFGVANIEFERVGGIAIGRQSQTWAKFGTEWRVVSAHVSLMASGH